jgi:septal ring factor EnvC (AmiA/AmiB activator)
MSENEETKETKETQETPENPNEVSTPEDLEAIKAELEEEKQAKAAAEAALAEKDTHIAGLEERITDLESQVGTLHNANADAATELEQVREAKDQAVAKYLNMAKALNPAVPEGIIAGETIEEIDTSVEKGKGIVDAVKQAMESEAKETKVPVGAPPRTEISLEGLTPREKIAAGIQQKGGTS